MDAQTALLHGLWRKAYRAAAPLAIPCHTESNATRLRFALYNAVRNVRTGKLVVDDELLQAVENCSIGFAPDDRTALLFQRTVMTELMGLVTGLIGEEPGLVKTEEEMVMEASQSRVREQLAAPEDVGEAVFTPADTRTTPYYTR